VPYFAAGFKFGHAICKEVLKGDEITEIQDIIATLAAKKTRNYPKTQSSPFFIKFVARKPLSL